MPKCVPMNVSEKWAAVCLKAEYMAMEHYTPQRNGIRRSTWAFALASLALLFLNGCRITDHTEENDEVDPQHISFPASGYQDVDLDNMPVLAMEQTHLDMGQIVQGSTIEHRFTFTNTGGSALVIADVRGSCGCTVSKDWPRTPIAPGATGGVTVSFDSEGRSGKQNKTVTIVANTTPPSTVLTLAGEVVGVAGLEPLEPK